MTTVFEHNEQIWTDKHLSKKSVVSVCISEHKSVGKDLIYVYQLRYFETSWGVSVTFGLKGIEGQMFLVIIISLNIN